ncbi:MAG: phenylacetic acid degradation protein [Sulfobacillus thermosulfidooxidans]|uniref:Phenylacetic acid degradation protein n=1 Tax=Sulfobacillus thermotolerans TaxID=338644 RepID=A0ABN5H075_9FIRM|nr:phenylacetic acid degradation protein [Sulfobacillus sp. hq2]AUW93824.1 phenylacetic acid degradation protein [Sulfobacillus thermotolerans]MCY0908757.1 phenylacetic acid degradation protein [Sulfobacillus thermotolerans]POB11363.1 phenylacetic acid degradation protein [Sulfobacillus sp. hq2]PSR36962.1 MAG: phenylacetic acid degradation protein [Sulfobacillus thermosulfidooxidans]
MALNAAEYRVYEVFVQRDASQFHVNVGSLRAVNSEMALQMARETFFRREEPCEVWVVPQDCIVASPRDSAYLPVHTMDKQYRLPAGYDNAPRWKRFKAKAMTIEEVAEEMATHKQGGA